MVNIQSLCHPFLTKFLDPKEDSLSNRDFDVFDLVLTINGLFKLKDKIIEDPRVSQDSFYLLDSVLVKFFLPQVLRFPKFFEWCGQHYSKT